MYIPRESPIMHVQHRQSKSKIEAIRAKFRAWSHANEKSNPKGKKKSITATSPILSNNSMDYSRPEKKKRHYQLLKDSKGLG